MAYTECSAVYNLYFIISFNTHFTGRIKSTRVHQTVFITRLKEVLYLITVLLLIMPLQYYKFVYNNHIEKNSMNMKFTANIFPNWWKTFLQHLFTLNLLHSEKYRYCTTFQNSGVIRTHHKTNNSKPIILITSLFATYRAPFQDK